MTTPQKILSQIPLQARQFHALDGAVRKQPAELGWRHGLDGSRRERKYVVTRSKVVDGGWLRQGVVRAHQLALVAAVQAVAFNLSHPLGQLFATVFNEQARQASRRIEGAAIGTERTTGTRIHASAAAATSACFRGISGLLMGQWPQ